MPNRRGWAGALAALLVGLAIAALAAGVPAPGATSGSGPPASTNPVAGGPGGNGLPAIFRTDLPPEAWTTLDRIAAGGPYPHAADGALFQNRERRLPLRPAGTYREYTVETPGSTDRGGRRIVVAASGEAYWTADHYASFFRILP